MTDRGRLVALTATILKFRIELSDVDRGVYETLELRVAQHPSETDAFLVTRVLAFALESGPEGLEMGRGVSTPEDPAFWRRSLTGTVELWVDIGNPSPERLHRASKAAQAVAVYTHKDAEMLQRRVASTRVHRAEEIALFAVSAELIEPLAELLGRQNDWSVVRTGPEVYVTAGGQSIVGQVTRLPLVSG
ncbi:MAG: YaeQ family protein [Myxococcota bacterium]